VVLGIIKQFDCLAGYWQVLLCICGLMSIFAGMSWLNNVYLSWIKRVWINDEADISAIKGLFPSIDWVCIDHSTVSTFIPFFSLVWLSAAFFRLGRWVKVKKKAAPNNEFPYFSGYNEWMVALGLMGTVWGLIMIGYLPNLDNLKITDLIDALHTALFSTLVALIWVYIIVLRIIRPFMHWYAAKFEVFPPPPIGLEEAIKKLVVNIETLNGVIAQSTKIINEFRKKVTIDRIDEVNEFFKTCNKVLPVIENSCEQQRDTLAGISKLMIKQIDISGKNEEHLRGISSIKGELKRIGNLLNKKNEREKRNREGLGKIFDTCRKYFGED
jgi:hypothetical protein